MSDRQLLPLPEVIPLDLIIQIPLPPIVQGLLCLLLIVHLIQKVLLLLRQVHYLVDLVKVVHDLHVLVDVVRPVWIFVVLAELRRDVLDSQVELLLRVFSKEKTFRLFEIRNKLVRIFGRMDLRQIERVLLRRHYHLARVVSVLQAGLERR